MMATPTTETPECGRAREIAAGQWVFAHNDGRKLSHHTDEGIWWQFDDIPGALYQRPQHLRRWAEVNADLIKYARGTQLPAA